MNLEKLNLSIRHIGLLLFPVVLLIMFFFVKSYFVNNIKSYFNLMYLSKYTISDEYLKYSFVRFPEKRKIDIYKLAYLLPYSKKMNISQEILKLPSPSIKKPRVLKLTFIYIGKNKKFAEINGELYTEGSKISPTIKIVRIERNRVLIEELGRKKWLQFLE